MKKNVYVVLGMARSGTSVIARGLKALGIELGDKLTPAKENWNAKGFFEDKDIVYKINRGLLATLEPPLLNALNIQNNPVIADIKKAAINLLKQRVATSQHWGFKDPRTCMLLPFWQDVFAALNLNDHYVIALRNPLSSASSYQKLSDGDLEEALLLWLIHQVAAIEGTHAKDRVVVSYELMLQDPQLQLNRIRLALNVPNLADASEVETYANEFLDKELHHYENDKQELASHPAISVVPLCAKVYDLLLKVAKDDLRLDGASFKSAWSAIMTEFNLISPIYNYIHVLLHRNKQLQRKIRNTQKSILWKLLYPLHFIDDMLRKRRHHLREKQRLQNI